MCSLAGVERSESAIVALAFLIDTLLDDLDASVLVVDKTDHCAHCVVDIAKRRYVIVAGSGYVAAPGACLLRLYELAVPRLVRLLLFCAEQPVDERERFREAGLEGIGPLDLFADLLPHAPARIRLWGSPAGGSGELQSSAEHARHRLEDLVGGVGPLSQRRRQVVPRNAQHNDLRLGEHRHLVRSPQE